jgi:hypothetical protein
MASPHAADRAFCSPHAPEVFHSVQHKNDVWKEDPFDVESIHPDAREVFARLIDRVAGPQGVSSGRILLLRGESGAGKTHLMRAFRNDVHRRGRGFFGYMQLTSKTDNYARYILRNVIDSLDKPYYEPNGAETGLMRLSNAFAERPRIMYEGFPDRPEVFPLRALRELELPHRKILQLVQVLADRVLHEEGFENIDLDLIRAFLYLQTGDPVLKGLVVKYLRCEELAPADREALGGLVSRHGEDDPAWVLEQLGRIVYVATGAALVVCVDQLEDIFNFDEGPDRFRSAIGTLRALIDNVPNSVVVISCLEEYYQVLRQHLDRATLDRVEFDPPPLTLKSLRDRDEVRLIAEKRLRYLYDTMDVDLGELPPFYPFTEDHLDLLAHMRTRDVLDWFRDFQDKCRARGRILGPDEPVGRGGEAALPSSTAPLIALEQAWNDYVTAASFDVPTDDAGLTDLLHESLERCRAERPATAGYTVARASEEHPEIIRLESAGTPLALRLCNKRAQGGSLAKELAQFEEAAPGCKLVILRTTAFPRNPKTEIARVLGALVANGAARFQVEPSEWHAMAALRGFEAEHGKDPHFAAWLEAEKPLTRLPSLQGILALVEPLEEEVEPETAAPAEVPEPQEPSTNGDGALPPLSAVVPVVEEAPVSENAIVVGDTRGIVPVPVVFEPEEFKRHAAFLGGSGSGKTTLALHIVEQLVLRGIPAVLVDRKGDLCGYAKPYCEESETLTRLREQADVALYTPGDSRGRDLSIALLPPDAASLSSIERDSLASFCADGLAGMMNYRTGARDQACRGILKKSVEVLLELSPDKEITAEALCDFVESQDPVLLNAVGNLDSKLFGKLAQDLRVLLLNKERLLKGTGERLNAEKLFGLDPAAVPGKTRLTIISTKFIGDAQDVEFWVTQLLLELGRWTSRTPSPRLQGVIFFDEADLYLPAQRKPSTKGPMEDLLRRARSAGLGMLLATQSPGDFDYKCRENIRTWMLGRIKEETAIRKMRPMLNEVPGDLAALLPGQKPGEFQVVRDGQAVRMQARRNALPAQQLPQEEILALAREQQVWTRPGSG